jgi:hypothetical protein
LRSEPAFHPIGFEMSSAISFSSSSSSSSSSTSLSPRERVKRLVREKIRLRKKMKKDVYDLSEEQVCEWIGKVVEEQEGNDRVLAGQAINLKLFVLRIGLIGLTKSILSIII